MIPAASPQSAPPPPPPPPAPSSGAVQQQPQAPVSGGPMPSVSVSQTPDKPQKPIDIPVTQRDKGFSPASLMKKVLESRGYSMANIKGNPRVLSMPEATDGSNKSIQIDYNEHGGKKFAKLPVIYEVEVERPVLDASGHPTIVGGKPVMETETLRFQQDWYTSIEMPNAWGGRAEEHFQTMIEESFRQISTHLEMIGHASRGQLFQSQRNLNIFRMQKSLFIGNLSTPSTHFYGRKIHRLSPGVQQLSNTPSIRGAHNKLTGRKEDPITSAGVYMPRKPARALVMSEEKKDLSELEERRRLLKQLQEKDGSSLASIAPGDDRDFAVKALKLQCEECLDDLYGVSETPQDSLSYYHPDLTDAKIAQRKEQKAQAEALKQHLDTLHLSPTIVSAKTFQKREAFIEREKKDLERQGKSLALMEKRAKATLKVFQEAHKTLLKNIALLKTIPHDPETSAALNSYERRAAELEGQIRNLEAHINHHFPKPATPPSPAAPPPSPQPAQQPQQTPSAHPPAGKPPSIDKPPQEEESLTAAASISGSAAGTAHETATETQRVATASFTQIPPTSRCETRPPANSPERATAEPPPETGPAKDREDLWIDEELRDPQDTKPSTQ